MSKLELILRRKFLHEGAASLAEVLKLAAETGRISYEEVEAHGGSMEDLLLAFNERLLLPVKTSRAAQSLAWEDRILTLKRGEVYEMPNVIRYLMKRVEETGKWEPEYAIRMYLEDIGEKEVDKILELFRRIRKNILSSELPHQIGKVSASLLKELSSELGLDAGKTIVELKGGGIINPFIHNLRRELLYEVNPSLFK